jgi:hypothetical protein
MLRRRTRLLRKRMPREKEDEEEGAEDTDDGDEGKEVVCDIEGNTSIYKRPYSRFPILRHHAHPFLVIHNALPKLQPHSHHFPMTTSFSMCI